MNTSIIVGFISLAGVIMSGIITFYIGKQSINANVVAKARIEWIQTVRKYVGEYISLSYYLIQFFSQNGSYKAEKENILDEKPQENLKNFEKLRFLITMYFGENEKNDEFISKIENVSKKILPEMESDDKLQKYFKSDIYNKECKKSVEELVKFAREYFKNEWEKVKKNK